MKISNIPRSAAAIALVPQISCVTQPTSGGCNMCDVINIFTNASNIIGGIMGAIALVMFIVGGFIFIFSNGNDQRIELGKKILTNTVIGLAVIMFAWVGVNFIIRVAYSSSVGNAYALVGKPTPKIFSHDWWAPNCIAATEPCSAGKLVGDACGKSGDCPSDKTTSCSCFRKLDPTKVAAGEAVQCGTTDVTSVSEAATSTDGCYCADQCSQLKYTQKSEYYTSRTWQCVVKTTTVEKDDGLEKKYDVPCAMQNYVCVGTKTASTMPTQSVY